MITAEAHGKGQALQLTYLLKHVSFNLILKKTSLSLDDSIRYPARQSVFLIFVEYQCHSTKLTSERVPL